MTRAFDRPPPGGNQKQKEPDRAELRREEQRQEKDQRPKHTPTGYTLQLASALDRRRFCASCGVPFYADHPRHDLCVGCHKWLRIGWFVHGLAREVAR